jgi:hypothetical protein
MTFQRGERAHSLSFFFFLFAACSAVTWSNETAVAMLKISRAVYCDPASIKSWNCSACSNSDFEVTALLDGGLENFGLVGVWRKTAVIVAFRGSSNVPNWIENLTFIKGKLSPYLPDVPGVGVHSGFRQGYVSMQKQVHEEVLGLMARLGPSAPVYVTGHSLGAALAGLCSLDLIVSLGLKQTVAYTFGQPRIGDKGFRDYVVSRGSVVWRFVNMRDIVPHLPLDPVMGFFHEPTEMWIEDLTASVIKQCDASGEDPTCSDSFSTNLSVYDHLHYYGVQTSSCAGPF